MSISTQLTTNDPRYDYFVQQNNQNSLKGIAWGVGGSALSTAALTLTAGTVVGVSAAALGIVGTLINDSLRNSVGSVSVPALVGLSASAIAVDYFAVKFTGYCFSNSIHHLGPEFKIIAKEKTN